MGVIVRMNRPDVVISLYQKMELRRIPFNIYSFNILMKCFCDSHKLSFALSTFGKITKLGFQADVVTFSTLLHGFCQMGDLNGALNIFEEMISSGVAPNDITFRGMLACLCSKKEQRKAVAMLVDLQHCVDHQLKDE